MDYFLNSFLSDMFDNLTESKDLLTETTEEIRGYSRELLTDTITGYTTVTPVSSDIRNVETNWKYVLLPVWVLTYRDNKKETYYYAMNGQSGKIGGKLPLDRLKLGLVSGGIALATLGALLLWGYFIL